MSKKTSEIAVKEQPEGNLVTHDDLVQRFLARVTRLEARYAGMKYATSWLVPKDELLAIRNELQNRQGRLFT